MRDLYELIGDKLDGTLDKDGEAELELRLSSDPEAREIYELLTSAHATLDFEIESPKELLQNVLEGVKRENRGRKRRIIRVSAGFVAAAAVLAIALIPGAVRDRNPHTSPYCVDPDLIREYRDDATDTAPCYNSDATDGNAPVFSLPTDGHFTAETFCADYYAVLYFETLPRELMSADPVIFSDGTVGCVITAEAFEEFRDDAREIAYPNPDGTLLMAVGAPAP